jgi:hypothetical protein
MRHERPAARLVVGWEDRRRAYALASSAALLMWRHLDENWRENMAAREGRPGTGMGPATETVLLGPRCPVAAVQLGALPEERVLQLLRSVQQVVRQCCCNVPSQLVGSREALWWEARGDVSSSLISCMKLIHCSGNVFVAAL